MYLSMWGWVHLYVCVKRVVFVCEYARTHTHNVYMHAYIHWHTYMHRLRARLPRKSWRRVGFAANIQGACKRVRATWKLWRAGPETYIHSDLRQSVSMKLCVHMKEKRETEREFSWACRSRNLYLHLCVTKFKHARKHVYVNMSVEWGVCRSVYSHFFCDKLQVKRLYKTRASVCVLWRACAEACIHISLW
jgi:hypothetical protein